MALLFEIQNQKVETWMRDTQKEMQTTGLGMGITHRPGSPSSSASLPKVRGRAVFDGAAIRAVAFRFPRSLVYPHSGAGRGHGGAKGSRWYTSGGVAKRTNPASLNKQGTGKRTAKPFLSNVLDRKVPQLADIVAETSADIVTANIFK